MNFDLPQTLELPAYRLDWPDLAGLSDDEITRHYTDFGQEEGRKSNRIATRQDFVELIPIKASVLEIGPFYCPLAVGPTVKYFDVLDQHKLKERASQLGLPADRVPEIDFVSPVGDLSVVRNKFDCVLSSHCLEHQPDLIGHLRHVSRLLREEGRYFMLIPDHRYIFDALIATSTVADVVDANLTSRTVHTLRSVIEHRALTTHNLPDLHWKGEHGSLADLSGKLRAAVQEWKMAAGGYVDVHAWYFTPSSIVSIMDTLRAADYIDLEVERIYPTRRGSNEFWMIMRKI